MQFTVNKTPEPLPVNITLALAQYCGCQLPTLYANNIPILHILEDGRICIRSFADTNMIELNKLGFCSDQRELVAVRSSDLGKGFM